MMKAETHKSLSDKLISYLIGAAILGVPISIVVFVIWTLFSSIQEAQTIAQAPVSRATAVVTSKDNDQHLSVKSADLPKGGDVVAVDQFAYGAVVTGDSVCVRYKQISDDPQYGTEFVGKGVCQK